MRYIGYIVVAAMLAGAVSSCEQPYYARYSYIYASDYYYPSSHMR
jgi:hypothetical protein